MAMTQAQVRAVNAARMRDWRRLHPDESRQRAAAYRREHVEELAVARRRRYRANRAEHLARSRAYRQANRDQINAQKRATYAAKTNKQTIT